MKSNYDLLQKKYPDIYSKIKIIKTDYHKYEVVDIRDDMYTLKINGEETFYLHSKYNPTREAQKLIEDNYSDEFKNYVVFGLGFGYHIEELLKKDGVYINIIESNLQILKLALDNIDLENILSNPRVEIYLGDSVVKFRDRFIKASKWDNYKLILHNPSIKSLPEDMKEIRHLLEEFKVKELSAKNINHDFYDNFEYNKENYDETVNVLFNKYAGKPIFLVAAGPSLDKNKHLLKEVGNRGLILCVGRAVRPLLSVGVKPDIIIVTDLKDHIYSFQLRGLDIDVPVIVLSTCDKNVMKNYSGHKYIAFQSGFDKAEEYAKELGVETVETGGSVATTALDIAIRMGGSPIVFLGQDLAFSGGHTHASSTYSRQVKENSNLRQVESIEGDLVYTSKNLSIYLRWIESRIRQEQEIVFIDATEGGAKIEGTKIMNLKVFLDMCR